MCKSRDTNFQFKSPRYLLSYMNVEIWKKNVINVLKETGKKRSLSKPNNKQQMKDEKKKWTNCRYNSCWPRVGSFWDSILQMHKNSTFLLDDMYICTKTGWNFGHPNERKTPGEIIWWNTRSRPQIDWQSLEISSYEKLERNCIKKT